MQQTPTKPLTAEDIGYFIGEYEQTIRPILERGKIVNRVEITPMASLTRRFCYKDRQGYSRELRGDIIRNFRTGMLYIGELKVHLTETTWSERQIQSLLKGSKISIDRWLNTVAFQLKDDEDFQRARTLRGSEE